MQRIPLAIHAVNHAQYGVVVTASDFTPANAPAARAAIVGAAQRTVAKYLRTCARMGLDVDPSVESYAVFVVGAFDAAVAQCT
jgi:hypothetical protein